MEITPFQEAYFEPLYSYWQQLGKNVPYFFPVTRDAWRRCLLKDRLDGQPKFTSLETWLALADGRVVGFIQYGQPAFSWDQNGNRQRSPRIGMIRHIYFEEGRTDAARGLYACSTSFMEQFPVQHAFYHILGMRCNAHHGKLHHGLAHIERFIMDHGYQVEHENVYYTLAFDSRVIPPSDNLGIVPKSGRIPASQEYEIHLRGENIGSIQVRFLEDLTGGGTRGIAYLSWIGIEKTWRGQGWGTRALGLLITSLSSQGYRQLHTDTPSTNTAAQRFYERLGFTNQGITRSYIKDVSRRDLGSSR